MSSDAAFVKENPMAPAAFGMLTLWVNGAADEEVTQCCVMLRDMLNVVLDG
jgi:hypothetical protein